MVHLSLGHCPAPLGLSGAFAGNISQRRTEHLGLQAFNTLHPRGELVLVQSQASDDFCAQKHSFCKAEAAPVSTIAFRFVRVSQLPTTNAASNSHFGAVIGHQVTQ